MFVSSSSGPAGSSSLCVSPSSRALVWAALFLRVSFPPGEGRECSVVFLEFAPILKFFEGTIPSGVPWGYRRGILWQLFLFVSDVWSFLAEFAGFQVLVCYLLFPWFATCEDADKPLHP